MRSAATSRALTAPEFERLFAAAGLSARFQTTVPIDMDIEEWLTHGGPDAHPPRRRSAP